jgi:uncharacterized protein (TIGR00369 family)
MQDPSFERSQLTADLSPLARKLGVKCRQVEEDSAVYELAFDQSNTTIADLVHGGALLALADCAATGAAWSRIEEPDRYRGLTVDLSLSFLGPARSADLIATARVIRRGATLCYCTVDICTADEQAVAHSQVVYKLQRKLEPAEIMSGLFEGRSTAEQMRILTDLETAGASLYRAWADAESHDDRKRELLDAADRETANAEILLEINRRLLG